MLRRVSRRDLLQLSGAGAAAAATGGLAAIIASGRAPAYAQQTTIHWLRVERFRPRLRPAAAQQDRTRLRQGARDQAECRDDQCQRHSGPRHVAVQSGTGPDIICALNNWPQLYADSVADVSDIAEELGKTQGGFYDASKLVANDGKKWIAVPWCIVGAASDQS